MRRVIYGVVLVCSFAACANDPVYLTPSTNLEAGQDDGTGNAVVAKASLMIPIKPESASDKAARMKEAAALGMMVPYVKVGDIDIEIEYTIKELDGNAGKAFIDLNGANEFFVYDPSMLNYAPPGDDEAPPTPPLDGNIPIDMVANGEVDGVFREDELEEASVDLDSITQGNFNPYMATLNINRNEASFQPVTMVNLSAMCGADPGDPACQQMPMGPVIPRKAFAEMIRIDLVFHPDDHMVLDFSVRVRDHRGIVNDMGEAAFMDDTKNVVMFMPPYYAN